MVLGMIGLGKMGANMAERLTRAGHQVVGYDRDAAAVKKVIERGGLGADSLPALARQLQPRRAIWIMVPAGDPVDQTIQALLPHLAKGDILIDGGNSNYKDSQRRGAELKAQGFEFLDVGTSGGIWGLREGYSMMIGGDGEAVSWLRPIFEALAPAADKGWGHVGPSGAGHFVKMVHNGIEYGLMQAYAEGFELIRRKEEFQPDLVQVAEIWRYGSVVRSWLLDLIADALGKNPNLEGIAPYVADSGEGRWTAKEAIDLGVAMPVISLALERRFLTHDAERFADRLLAVTRQEFGGHAVKTEAGRARG
ncbi:MAG TPA: decarboxylating 6-phosphogluconate dehydrogenase [Bryobacteraceae bacterium]|nr:decarboxylating 6-phosphogluconate dehydrogenase [Bryobacteraceae bacterium]